MEPCQVYIKNVKALCHILASIKQTSPSSLYWDLLGKFLVEITWSSCMHDMHEMHVNMIWMYMSWDNKNDKKVTNVAHFCIIFV